MLRVQRLWAPDTQIQLFLFPLDQKQFRLRLALWLCRGQHVQILCLIEPLFQCANLLLGDIASLARAYIWHVAELSKNYLLRVTVDLLRVYFFTMLLILCLPRQLPACLPLFGELNNPDGTRRIIQSEACQRT